MFLVPELVKQGNVGLLELRLNAEEAIEPEDATGTEHPINVEENELECGGRDPMIRIFKIFLLKISYKKNYLAVVILTAK